MKIKRIVLKIFCLLLVFSLLPVANATPEDLPAGAGERLLEGGQRDFRWPVPGEYGLTSCYLDNREHYSLDIRGAEGTPVVASYAGTVVKIDNSCTHNYAKEENCCSSWGNYVLLVHTYQLSDGQTVTLYSRYAHLIEAQVAEGDTVEAGQQIGTLGSTGHSSGFHLDYEILKDEPSPSSVYGLDPYINELLELPPELYCAWDADHCRDYVEYVKTFYTTCYHESYDAMGNCASCGVAYDWSASRKWEKQGYYNALAEAVAMTTPYAGEGGTPLSEETVYEVGYTVVNAFGETWYAVKLDDTMCFAAENALVLKEYYPSNLSGKLTSMWDGQVLEPAPYRLEGSITSAYPLRSVTAYLDGVEYATWNTTGEVYDVTLGNTPINHNLSFSDMAPGDHSLVITVVDSTEREPAEVISITFTIEEPTPEPTPDPEPEPEPEPEPTPDPDPEPENITVTFIMSPQNQTLELKKGKTLGKLPVPEQTSGELYFVGWFTAEVGGQMVTPYTVPDENMILYARWDSKTHTIAFDDDKVIVAHGSFLSELPEPTKEGFRFLGWYMENGEKMTTYVTVTEKITLKSRWEALNYTVTLNPNGGTVSKDTFVVTFGEEYGKLPKPEREGYIFMGWQLGSRAITGTVRVQTARDHVLTAVWQEKNPTSQWLLPAGAMILVGVMILFYVIGQRGKNQNGWRKA